MAQNPIVIAGPDKTPLTFLSMSGSEGLGRCFEYFIDVLSTNRTLKAKDIVGKPVTVGLPTGLSMRYFNGLVAGFEYRGTDKNGASSYRLTVRPALWFLTRAVDNRIFQKPNPSSVVDVLKTIFDHYAFPTDYSNLHGTYKDREYIVQYRETDFHFVTRLMEAEGIYYYFVHENGKHTMFLADSPASKSKPAKVPDTSSFVKLPLASADAHNDASLDYISEWSMLDEAQPGAYFQRDYDFDKANVLLYGNASNPKPHDLSSFEVYEYPGGFSANDPEGGDLAALRLEQLQARFELVAGAGNATALAVGAGFTLTDHPRPDQNKSYLVTAANYRLHGQSPTTGGVAESPFTCTFVAIDATKPFRMQPTATKPVMRGPQTAVVVGPKGEEIYADKYGRVKVKFHWDRDENVNENSSCYVRVAQIWAGAGWGAVFTPRIGQEVIVDFLEGDPDQPIIVGRLHNSNNMPPYDPSKDPTISGIRSHSSKGFPSSYNEIRFQDLKGKEELHIQAESAQTTLVKGNQSIAVGGNRVRFVAGNDDTTIGAKKTPTNQTVHVTADRTIQVDKNYSLEATDEGSIKIFHKLSSIQIAKDENIRIETENAHVSINKNGDIEISNDEHCVIQMLKGGAMKIENSKPLTILQTKNSIAFTDGKIVVQANDKVEIDAKEISLAAGATTVDLTASGATITASMINLNS
jgi:type VI secretion system secreted protein VgrG